MEAYCSCCGEYREIVETEIVHRYYCEDCLDIAKVEETDLWDRMEMRQLMLSMFKDLCADDGTFHELAKKGLIDKKYDFPVHERYIERMKILDIWYGEDKEFFNKYRTYG
jgi:hypothetical protein